jgi:hypothetical protein
VENAGSIDGTKVQPKRVRRDRAFVSSACRKSLLTCQTNGLLRLGPRPEAKEAAPNLDPAFERLSLAD